MNLRSMILATLKRVHPDVNQSPTAARDTRAMIAMLGMEPKITRRGGMTREQVEEFLRVYNDETNNPWPAGAEQ